MKRTNSAIVVLIISLMLCTCASAGVKGGTLSISKVTPTLYKTMNRLDSLVRLSTETLTLKDNQRFLCLHVEVSIDWSDNDKTTEHTILRKLIKLAGQDAEFPLIGRHAGNGDFKTSISSHIHLQKKDGNPYIADIVFAIPADLEKCNLQIEDSIREISIPTQLMKPTYKTVAKFKVVRSRLVDHIHGGPWPGTKDLFESEIRPLAGKMLEVVLEIEPLRNTNARTGYEGFYSANTERFSLNTNEIGILLKDELFLDSVAALSGGKAYDLVGSHQSFRDKWLMVKRTVYFCVPSDVREFRITHDKHPVAQGRVGP